MDCGSFSKSVWIVLIFFCILCLAYFLVDWNKQYSIQNFSSEFTPDYFRNGFSSFFSSPKNFVVPKKFPYRIVIASCVRNIEKNMNHIQEKLHQVSKYFSDYRIVFVENDSSDNTRSCLLNMAQKDPKIFVLGCGINAPNCSLSFPKTEGHSVNISRMNKMREIRNVYLKFVYTHFSNFDFLMVWDLDMKSYLYLDGIADTIFQFEKNPKINAICSNGIYDYGVFRSYYDTFAHVEINENPHINWKTFRDIVIGLKVPYLYSSSLKKVDSCFSGFTVYKLQSLVNNNAYHTSQDYSKNIECEHTSLSRQIGEVYLNPKMIHLIIENE